MRAIRNGVVLLLVVSLVACSTTRTWHTVPVERAASGVQEGDRVKLVANGASYVLTLTAVGPDGLYGTADSGKRYKIVYATITSLKVEHRETESHAAAFLGGAGIAMAVVIAFAGLAIAAALDALEDDDDD